MKDIDLDLAFHPITLPLMASAVILLWLGLYALSRKQRPNPRATFFSLMVFGAAFWTISYIFGLSSTALTGKIFWLRVKYIGSVFTPIMWLVFSLHFTKNKQLLRKPLITFLTAYCIVTLAIVFSSDYHGWMWQAVWIEPGLLEEAVIHGFYFWIYYAITGAAILTSTVFYIRFYFSAGRNNKLQALIMAMSSFIPMVSSFPFLFLEIDLVPQLDESILFLLISGLLFGFALFKLDALNILPIAHEQVINNMGLGLVVLDIDDHLLEANPAAIKLLQIHPKNSFGKGPAEIFHLSPEISLSQEDVIDTAIRNGSDDAVFYRYRINHIYKNKERSATVILISDISQEKRAEAVLTRMSIIDPLTEVINRRHFFILAEKELSRAQRYGSIFSIIMMDLDHFKAINDEHGHLVGDDVLHGIAQYCSQKLRKGDIFARYGGEEFVLILPETDQEQALHAANKLRKGIAEKNFSVRNDSKISITASFGISQYNNQTKNSAIQAVLNQADQALLQSKREGRNRCTIYKEVN